jgi:hypothetical protein
MSPLNTSGKEQYQQLKLLIATPLQPADKKLMYKLTGGKRGVNEEDRPKPKAT